MQLYQSVNVKSPPDLLQNTEQFGFPSEPRNKPQEFEKNLAYSIKSLFLSYLRNLFSAINVVGPIHWEW